MISKNPATHNTSFAEQVGLLISYSVLVGAITIALFPATWMFMSSIKPQSEIFSLPPTFFSGNPSFSNYSRVVFETEIPRSFFNSVLISSVTTFSVILIAILASYGFSRFNYFGSRFLSISLLFGQMMPAVVLLVPLFRIYASIGLIDSYEVNIISNIAINTPMAVLTLTAFFRSIPKELDEAALIDGSNRIQAIFKVLVPVSKPGIVTVGIFACLNTWEEFLFAMNFINSAKFKTLSVAIRDFRGQFIIDWGGMMSAAVIISFPVIFVFLFANKYFIEGITAGSLKG